MKINQVKKKEVIEKLNLKLTEIETHIKTLSDIYNNYLELDNMSEKDFNNLMAINDYLANQYSNILDILSKL